METIRRAIIIGGGIGGLCCAIGFHQAGIEPIVYEQADELSPVGAGLTLWANAIKALRILGLDEPVVAAGSRIAHAEIRTARGRTLSRSRPGELEQRFGAPTIAIHRADLHDILLSALPGGTVRLGARCVGFEQDENSVTASFADGFSDKADLLVGTDGIHSVIRGQLFPDLKLRYSGYTAWRGVVATKDESALGLSTESWGCGSRFGILRIDRERVYWFATANSPAGNKQTAAERKSFLQKRFRDWHHPVGLLIESTPAGEILQNDIYDLRPLKRWGNGRVVLLGDAAHPTTPNMGQGACMAIESSVILARSLSQANNLPVALSRYEAERMPRTAWVTDQSWKIGRLGQLENPLACKLRDVVTKLTPPALVLKTLERAVGYEL
ncbi:MAG TPA: FAD-dependent monooxygenase [Pyrinomonadaceae bacterium]|nr:FAD-dependent monooxygenase [Pyrinomonadaceae bacterium]